MVVGNSLPADSAALDLTHRFQGSVRRAKEDIEVRSIDLTDSAATHSCQMLNAHMHKLHAQMDGKTQIQMLKCVTCQMHNSKPH